MNEELWLVVEHEVGKVCIGFSRVKICSSSGGHEFVSARRIQRMNRESDAAQQRWTLSDHALARNQQLCHHGLPLSTLMC